VTGHEKQTFPSFFLHEVHKQQMPQAALVHLGVKVRINKVGSGLLVERDVYRVPDAARGD